jgi:hypothetical protein
MLIVESFEGLRIALLGSFDGQGFIKLAARLLPLLWLSVGQAAFSGRTLSDAAKYLCVVWLAGGRVGTKVTSLIPNIGALLPILGFVALHHIPGNPLLSRG